MTHYLYMNGELGCMPDYSTLCETIEDGLSEFDHIFDDATDEQRDEIERTGSVYRLNGAGYASIEPCDCNAPWEHCDGGMFGDCACFACEMRPDEE